MDPVTLGMAKADSKRKYARRGEQLSVSEPEQFFVPARIGTGALNHVTLGVGTGRMYFYKQTSPGTIVQSDDVGTSFSNAKTLPAGISAGSVATILEFAGNVYIYASDGSTFGVWRTPITAQGVDWGAWSAKLVSMPAGTSALSHISMVVSSWGSNDAVYISNYGDPSGGPVVKKSSDGTTWTNVYGPDNTIRHCHHLAVDPYQPGHLWLSLGDGINKSIMRSTDYGANWTVIVGAAAWQVVQISFTDTDIWCARDSLRSSVVIIDRATLTPRNGSLNFHHYIAPPQCAGVGYRVITDLAVTAGSATVTSATAAWTAADKGRYVQLDGIVAPGSFIISVNSATSVTLNRVAVSNASGGLGTPTYISGLMYFANAFFGVVDPATGIWYQISVDTSAAGQLYGLFYMREAGGSLAILDPGGPSYGISRAPIIHAGYLWVGNYRYKILSRVVA